MVTFPSFPGLAIDYPESKLYWISSGNGTINRCDLDGSNLEVIESVRSQLSKATALAIMGEGCQRGTPLPVSWPFPNSSAHLSWGRRG